MALVVAHYPLLQILESLNRSRLVFLVEIFLNNVDCVIDNVAQSGYECAFSGAVHRMFYRIGFLGYDFMRNIPARFGDSFKQKRIDFALGPAAQMFFLADDDMIEHSTGDFSAFADVLVAAITNSCNDADALGCVDGL